MSHLTYWHPSERTLKYRVKWYTDRTHRKDFPPTDKGLVKLARFVRENRLPGFGTGIYVQKKRRRGEFPQKVWVRVPYAIPISAVLSYLKEKGLLEEVTKE